MPSAQVRELVGPEGQVIGAVSGGVDSSVAAVLLQKAIGDRFHAVLVDNGLLRKNEAVDVVKRLKVRARVCVCFFVYVGASLLFHTAREAELLSRYTGASSDKCPKHFHTSRHSMEHF